MRAAGQFRDITIVWEGWAHEAIKYGRIRPERLELWEWKPGGTEPSEIDIIHADDAQAAIRGERRTPIRAEASIIQAASLSTSLMDVYGPDSVSTMTANGAEKRGIDGDGRLIVAATTKARVKLGNRAMNSDSQSLDNVLGSYRAREIARDFPSHSTNASGTITVESTSSNAVGESKRKDNTKGGRLAMIAAEPIDPVMGKAIGTTSVIHALSTSRAAAMTAPTPAARKIVNPIVRGPPYDTPSAHGPMSTTAATHQNLPPPQTEAEDDDDPESPSPIFHGLTFALVDLSGPHHYLAEEAIRRHDGLITLNEKEADWICVPPIK